MSVLHVFTVVLPTSLPQLVDDQYSISAAPGSWALWGVPDDYIWGGILDGVGESADLRYDMPENESASGIRIEFTYQGGGIDVGDNSSDVRFGDGDYRRGVFGGYDLSGTPVGSEIVVEMRGLSGRFRIAEGDWVGVDLDSIIPDWVDEWDRAWRFIYIKCTPSWVGAGAMPPYPAELSVSGWNIQNVRVYQLFGEAPPPAPAPEFWTDLRGCTEK